MIIDVLCRVGMIVLFPVFLPMTIQIGHEQGFTWKKAVGFYVDFILHGEEKERMV